MQAPIFEQGRGDATRKRAVMGLFKTRWSWSSARLPDLLPNDTWSTESALTIGANSVGMHFREIYDYPPCGITCVPPCCLFPIDAESDWVDLGFIGALDRGPLILTSGGIRRQFAGPELRNPFVSGTATTATSMPEPLTWWLFSTGLALAVVMRWRRGQIAARGWHRQVNERRDEPWPHCSARRIRQAAATAFHVTKARVRRSR